MLEYNAQLREPIVKLLQSGEESLLQRGVGGRKRLKSFSVDVQN
jgi:hypothetical protein